MRKYYTHRKPIRTASPTLRQLFNFLDEQKLAYRAIERSQGMTRGTLSKWRHGITAPNIMSVEMVVTAVKMQLKLQEL